MQIQSQKELNEVREKMLLEQAEMQSRFDAEIKDARARHDSQVGDLNERQEKLQAQV